MTSSYVDLVCADGERVRVLVDADVRACSRLLADVSATSTSTSMSTSSSGAGTEMEVVSVPAPDEDTLLRFLDVCKHRKHPLAADELILAAVVDPDAPLPIEGWFGVAFTGKGPIDPTSDPLAASVTATLVHPSTLTDTLVSVADLCWSLDDIVFVVETALQFGATPEWFRRAHDVFHRPLYRHAQVSEGVPSYLVPTFTHMVKQVCELDGESFAEFSYEITLLGACGARGNATMRSLRDLRRAILGRAACV
jgi:hypothetical protein